MEYASEPVINFTDSDFPSLWGYALLWSGRVEKDPTFPWVLLSETLAHLKSKKRQREYTAHD